MTRKNPFLVLKNPFNETTRFPTITVISLRYSQYVTHSTLLTVRYCTLFTIRYSQHVSVRYSEYVTHSTLLTVSYSLYVPHCTLLNVRYSLYVTLTAMTRPLYARTRLVLPGYIPPQRGSGHLK